MKKLLAIFMAVMLTVSLVACGGGKDTAETPAADAETPATDAPAEDAPEASEGEVELRVSWWGGDDRHIATLDAIERFEELHPNIKITPEYAGWDGWKDKITTQVAGGTAADVMQINYDWIKAMDNGSVFYDLTTLDEVDLSQWDDGSLAFGRVEDAQRAIPVSTTGRSLFYNKTTYDELGVDIPETWDDLFEAGKAFAEKDPSKYPFDLDTSSGFTGFYMSLAHEQQASGKLFLTENDELGFDEENLKNALDFYLSLEEGHVTRDQQTRMNDAGDTALYQTAQFIDGSVAGVLEWSSSIGKYEQVLVEADPPQELVLGELPILDGAENNGWFMKPSLLFAINEKTEHPVESAIFLNWLLNDAESAEILGTTRGIPSSKSAIAALEGSEELDGLAFEATEQIANADPVIVSPYLEHSDMKDAYKVAVESVSYGSSTTEEAAELLYTTVQQVLAEQVD